MLHPFVHFKSTTKNAADGFTYRWENFCTTPQYTHSTDRNETGINIQHRLTADLTTLTKKSLHRTKEKY